MTGPDSPNQTIQRFAITGTDLGIMWDNGDPANNQVLMAFGDTNGYCGIPGKQWRYNTLFRSSDRSLAKTVAVPNGVAANKYSGSPVWRPGISKQIINTISQAPQETGIIPTAGVSVGGKQYLNFMSIRSWDANGAWTTNFSAIAMSPDNGETLGRLPGHHPHAGRRQRELPDGRVPQAGPRRPRTSTRSEPQRPRRFGVRGARVARV